MSHRAYTALIHFAKPGMGKTMALLGFRCQKDPNKRPPHGDKNDSRKQVCWSLHETHLLTPAIILNDKNFNPLATPLSTGSWAARGVFGRPRTRITAFLTFVEKDDKARRCLTALFISSI